MSDFAQLSIEPRDPTKPLSGPNCRVLWDGRPIAGLKSVEFKLEAGELAEVSLKLYGAIRVCGQFQPAQISIQEISL